MSLSRIIKDLKDGRDATNLNDEYSIGMYNGIEYSLSVLENRNPEYKKLVREGDIEMSNQVNVRGFEPVVSEKREHEEKVVLPLRATRSSAGYDFFATEDLRIRPSGPVVTMATDVKVKMPEGEFMLLVPRSSLGGKLDIMMANTVGIDDSDYYGSIDTDGNIFLKLRNLKPKFEIVGKHQLWYTKSSNRFKQVDVLNSELEKIEGEEFEYLESDKVPNLVFETEWVKDMTEENTVFIKKGERIVQGIFIKYEVAENCNGEDVRKGGFGSTN